MQLAHTSNEYAHAVRLRASLRGPRQRATQLDIRQQAIDGRCEAHRITRRHKKRIASRRRQIRDAANVSRHYSAPASEVFE